MAHRATTRIVAAGATTALAAGTLALLSAGTANAAPGTLDWWDGNSHFTRTVSNTTPTIGETITVTTKFERGNSTNEKLNWVKDFHDPCLTYVASSATMNGNPVEPYLQIAPNFIAGDFNATSYQVTVKQTEPATLTAQYTIGGNCALGTALGSGMEYSGSLGAGYYTTKGPSTTATKANTSTTLDPVTGAKVGTATTLTATVTGAATGNTVEFYDGTTKIGQSALGANGTGTYQWTPTTAGDHTLTATFPSTANANSSESAPQTTTVTAADVASTTTLAPVTGAKEGTATTLTATVDPSGAGGTIEFKDGNDVLGTAQVGANGEATHQWTPTTAGQHTITATFSGRDGVLGSTTTQQVEVTVANSNSTVTLNPVTGAKVSTAITLTATVDPAAAGGTVTFKDDTTVLGTATVGNDGTATYQWTPTTAGQRTITADFSGHGTTNASTTHTTVTVAPSGDTNPGGNGSLGSIFGS